MAAVGHVRRLPRAHVICYSLRVYYRARRVLPREAVLPANVDSSSPIVAEPEPPAVLVLVSLLGYDTADAGSAKRRGVGRAARHLSARRLLPIGSKGGRVVRLRYLSLSQWCLC